MKKILNVSDTLCPLCGASLNQPDVPIAVYQHDIASYEVLTHMACAEVSAGMTFRSYVLTDVNADKFLIGF